MDFARIVLDELARRNININQAELASNLPQGFIRGVVRDDAKRAIPSIRKAEQIADALGLEFYIGPPRETGPIEHVTLNGADYAHIPVHDALLAAGTGCSNGSEQLIDQLAFRRDWLARIGVVASAARLARVQGDSMQTTMWPGDMILIDTRRNEPQIRQRNTHDQRRSPVYAMIDNGEARVKRIERPSPDIMILLSDNPDYAPELRQGRDLASIKIIGKVVWWGHTAKE